MTRDDSLEKALNKEVALALEDFMSEVSEECWCAGWLIDLEYTLWRYLTSGPGEFGMSGVTAEEIARLRDLSTRAGGWWRWDDDVGCVFVPIDEWERMYLDSMKAAERK